MICLSCIVSKTHLRVEDIWPFSARMVHSRQSRAKRPFQPVFETENNVFRSPDGWLSQRSWVSDWRTPENGSESPSLSDHRFSHSPLTAYPSVGCFVSANLLKLRHLCRFSVWQDYPCGEGIKGRFEEFSGCFPAVFLRLKRPSAFPLNRLSPPQNLTFSAYFLNSVRWMPRERR